MENNTQRAWPPLFCQSLTFICTRASESGLLCKFIHMIDPFILGGFSYKGEYIKKGGGEGKIKGADQFAHNLTLYETPKGMGIWWPKLLPATH